LLLHAAADRTDAGPAAVLMLVLVRCSTLLLLLLLHIAAGGPGAGLAAGLAAAILLPFFLWAAEALLSLHISARVAGT
jgi:hypothetical protein